MKSMRNKSGPIRLGNFCLWADRQVHFYQLHDSVPPEKRSFGLGLGMGFLRTGRTPNK